MEKLINNIEKNGNEFIDNVLIPISKAGKYIIKDTEYIKSFLILKSAFIENRISQFLNFLEYKSEKDILDFINNLLNFRT